MKTQKTNTVENSGLKNRIAQQEKTELPRIDMARRKKNRGLSVEALLELIRAEAPDFWNGVEVVGKWVWLAFEGKQPKQVTAILAELGFHWNNRRQVWQHPCGMVTERADFDPRRKYRSYYPAEQQAA